MNCSPTLTADEFKTLHNALWHLDCLKNEKVDAIVTEIREALKGAYEQDDKAFDTKWSHYERVRDDVALKSIWSIYEVENLSDRHPFEGADRVVYENHWGEKPVSKSINGRTWAALYVAADAAIRDSGDDHHIFIEQFTPSEEDPRTLLLTTGS